tara:strand:+ start:95 stop:475 length:381 start_codon:yes stop_codon:yes gene_type:complete
MALQSSGSISISQIKAEVGGSSSSLRTLSAAAGKSAPDGMQEFYNYSSYQTFYGSTITNFSQVCNQTTGTQYWHSGNSTYPVAGDTVYTNNSGSATLGNGTYKTANSYIMPISGGSGVVSSMTECE